MACRNEVAVVPVRSPRPLAHLPLTLALIVIALIVMLGLVLWPGLAAADTRGVLRVGVSPVDLAPASDTPLLGGPVDEAIEAYNVAAGAYNAAHGLPASSPMATQAIDHDDLGVQATLFTINPGLEVGGEPY